MTIDKQQSQAGVTLLIAILILSIVLAVSLSLSTILLSENRSSGDLTRTEPALYGANSVTEEALYDVKRGINSSDYSTLIGHTALSNIITPLNDPIQRIKIPSNATALVGTPNEYALYNPFNPYGPSLYGRIKLTFVDTNTPGAHLHIYLCQWDPQNPPQNPDGTYKNVCSDPNDTSYWVVNNFLVSPGQTWDTDLSCGGCIDEHYQQELFIFQDSSPATNLFAELETYDQNGLPTGIPYFGKTAINISAFNINIKRNVRVVIPNGVPSQGSTANTPGTIVLTVNTNGPDGSFPFTMRDVTNLSDQSLPANYTAVISGGSQSVTRSFSVTANNSYQIFENFPYPSGWSLTSKDCFDGTDHFNPSAAGGFPVSSGGTVTCIFVNEKPPAVPTPPGPYVSAGCYNFDVPTSSSVTTVTFEAWGADGGQIAGGGVDDYGGNGGYAKAKFNVVGGKILGASTLKICVGGQGDSAQDIDHGFWCETTGAGGGGYTSVSIGNLPAGTPLVIAGGGGGASGSTGALCTAFNNIGGDGGGLNGCQANYGACPGNAFSTDGLGGTQTGGGAFGGGQYLGGDGLAGNGGFNGGGGGSAGSVSSTYGKGGGGGGYYGGGLGKDYGHAGGGGSGYVDPSAVTSTFSTGGNNSSVKIIYNE